jgi:cyclophilin family peptidyl-prolyl cis-trans isomerase
VLFLKGLNKKWFITLGMSSKRKVKVKTYNPQKQNKNRKQLAMAIIAVIVVAFVGYVVVTHLGPSSQLTSQQNTPSPAPTASASPSSSGSPYPSVNPLTSPAGEYSASGTKILFITSKGDIVIQMRDDKPITTANFVKLVNEGYYNNTIFQRVIAGFMIQGGEGKTTQPTITNLESGDGNSNLNMTIAMANAGGTNTASTQFFINVADNSNLDTGYTVFGQVIYGQNVVMAISNTPVGYSSEYQANVLPTPTISLIGAVVMP